MQEGAGVQMGIPCKSIWRTLEIEKNTLCEWGLQQSMQARRQCQQKAPHMVYTAHERTYYIYAADIN